MFRQPALQSLYLLVLALGGCTTVAGNAGHSLYDRLGGEPVLSAALAEVVDEVAANPRVNQSFEKVRLSRLKKHLHTFVCNLADGGCDYRGDPIPIVHAGLKIHEAEFNAVVQALRDALDRRGVPQAAKNELLRRLAPLKRDIVTA
jgi:hemoglobin